MNTSNGEVKTVLLSLEEVRSSASISISISVSQVICIDFKAAEIVNNK